MNHDLNALKILCFTNGTESHIWRFDPVARRINNDTPHQMAITKWDQWKDTTLGADIIILEMLSGHQMVETSHNMGAKVIYEADDAVLDTYGNERNNLQQVDNNFRSKAIETIRKCDAVTVTSEVLAENYRRFTDKPVYVLPILMDFEYYGDAADIVMPERNTDEIRLGWFGGKSHFDDLKMIIPTIKKMLDKYPKLKFIYAGYGGMGSDSLAMQTLWGEDVFEVIPRHRREFVPGVPGEYWKYKHRFMDLDIGICPLIEDEFNKNKVATKWLEYSAMSTPSICSPTVYKDIVKHNKTGIIADTPKEWEKAFSRLIEDAELRKKLGKQAKQDVLKNHNIETRWHEWLKVYREIVAA